MKRAIIITAILALVAGVGGGVWLYRYTRNLEYKAKEASERAAQWGRKFAEAADDTAGSTDEWFEKNTKVRHGQPEDLLVMADKIGLKHIRKTNVVYVDSDDTVAVHGTYSNGLYGDPDGRTIRVARNLSDSAKRTTLAHEYLHYIWHNSAALQNDMKLEQKLLNMYDITPWLRNRMSPYRSNQMVSRTELFSIACTEISDGNIDTYVRQQCDKWIHRSELEMRY